MDGWMDGCVRERSGWVVEWMGGRMSEQMSRRVSIEVRAGERASEEPSRAEQIEVRTKGKSMS